MLNLATNYVVVIECYERFVLLRMYMTAFVDLIFGIQNVEGRRWALEENRFKFGDWVSLI
jgi:hypothetical protein